jgi:hypothetical protein
MQTWVWFASGILDSGLGRGDALAVIPAGAETE